MSDNAAAAQPRDIALHVRDGTGSVQLLRETHRSTDPLHYPTLFPAGNDGWHLQLSKAIPHSARAPRPSQLIEDQAAASSESARKVTARERVLCISPASACDVLRHPVPSTSSLPRILLLLLGQDRDE